MATKGQTHQKRAREHARRERRELKAAKKVARANGELPMTDEDGNPLTADDAGEALTGDDAGETPTVDDAGTTHTVTAAATDGAWIQ